MRKLLSFGFVVVLVVGCDLKHRVNAAASFHFWSED
jgi:hypothetical protein